jgi:hypothetical protein
LFLPGHTSAAGRIFRAAVAPAGSRGSARDVPAAHDREEVYNILWALVFGFATLNILSLGARRFEQEKSGLNFGEILAILVVVVSIVLLAWEMLYVFGILPIRLTPR